jgi:hypothetical protein
MKIQMTVEIVVDVPEDTNIQDIYLDNGPKDFLPCLNSKSPDDYTVLEFETVSTIKL